MISPSPTDESPATSSDQQSPTLVSGVLEDSEAPMDDKMRAILGHGPFQWMALFCGSLALMVLVFQMLSPRLIARDVDHWCKPPGELAYLTPDSWKKAAIPVEPDGSFSRCTMYDPPLEPNGTVRGQNNSNRDVVSCEDWAFEEGPNRSIVKEWRLVCSRRWQLTLSAAAFTSAAIAAVPAAGIVADHIGRKPVTSVAVVALIIAGLGSSTADSFVFFSVARAVVSCSASTVQVLTFILLFEITNSEHRFLYAFIDVSLGVMLVPFPFMVIDFAEVSWTTTLVLLMVPSSALICTFYMLTESPRWLLVVRDTKRARQIIRWAANTNGLSASRTLQGIELLFREIQRQDELPVVKITALDFFRYSLLRERCASLALSWFTSYFAFYGFRLAHGLSEQLWAEYLFAATSGVVNVSAYVCAVQFGRRKVLFTALVILAWSSTLLAMLYKQGTPATGSSVAALVAKGAADVAIGVNYVYTAELFPTVVRSIGMCSLYASGRLGAVSGAVILELTTDADKINVVFLFLAVISFISAAMVQCLPDTTPKIPDTVQEACMTESERKKVIQKSLELSTPIKHPNAKTPASARTRTSLQYGGGL